MVLGSARNGDKEVLMLGLTRRNVEELMKGRPMLLRRETHGEGIPEGWEVFIWFGEDEIAMRRELQAQGLIDEAKIRIDNRLTDA